MSDEATFYAIPGSHPARTGELMLEPRGLRPLTAGFAGASPNYSPVRLRGFPGDRVPAVRFADGRRGQGTRPLARVLDEVKSEPRLVPGDPRVEEAERWGDEALQQWARRMVIEAGTRDPDALHARGSEGRLGPLLTRHERARRPTARMVKVGFRMTPAQLREDQRRVGEMLDRVDCLIADGVLDGERLNCADFQIATSLALVDYRLDVRPELRRRRAGELMERLLPEPS